MRGLGIPDPAVKNGKENRKWEQRNEQFYVLSEFVYSFWEEVCSIDNRLWKGAPIRIRIP